MALATVLGSHPFMEGVEGKFLRRSVCFGVDVCDHGPMVGFECFYVARSRDIRFAFFVLRYEDVVNL